MLDFRKTEKAKLKLRNPCVTHPLPPDESQPPKETKMLDLVTYTSAKNQVVGVYSKELTTVFAEVLKKLGSHHVLSVHGADGMDEISITGKTYIAELKNGKILEYEFNPQDYGFKLGRIEDAVESYQAALEINPNYAKALLYKSLSLKNLGNFQDSIDSCKKAIKLQPEYGIAHRHLTSMRTYSDKEDSHLKEME